MKKLLFILVAFALAAFLVACGSEDSEPGNSTEATNEENGEDEATGGDTDTEEDSDSTEEETEESVDAGEVIEDEVGRLSIVSKHTDIEEVYTSGPMEITILGVQTAELEPNEAYGDFFDNKDNVTIVTVAMKSENTSEDTISIYPDQATLTTNAGDQVMADMFLSDSIGGEFFGPTNKEGEVIFQLDTPAEEIDSITLIIDGAHDDNFETIGEDLRIEVGI